MTSNRVRQPGSGHARVRPLPQEMLVGIGSLTVVAAGIIASMVPPVHSMLRFGLLLAMILVFVAVTGARWAAIVVGALGFLVFDGFLVNRLGELSWHGSADATRLVALAAAVISGRILGRRYGWPRRIRSGVPDNNDVRSATAVPIANNIERGGSRIRRP